MPEENIMESENGFTLIEIIVTLVLVGVLAAVAGTGIVSMTQGYLFVKDNTVIAGKAQVALERITREVSELRTIRTPATDAKEDSIVFDKVIGSTAIGLVQNEIRLATGSVGTKPDFKEGDVLADQVSLLRFDYRKGDGDPWTSSDNIPELSHVRVTLTMRGSGAGTDFTFSSVIHPRNNGNMGGEPVENGGGENGNGGCFISTVCYRGGL
jgi:prepilin-type N-terminal cleavage/methylation domain-containing protein